MRLLATFADELARLGGPIAGGAAVGTLFAFLFGACAQVWVGRAIPLERWALWGGGIGSLMGLVAVLYDE